MKKQHTALIIFITAILLQLTTGSIAWGDDQKPNLAPAPADTSEPTAAERVNTETIKEKYWARGEESEIGVVQNRLYSKAGRYEFSLLGGLDMTDPFLTVYTFGGRIGYHFSEYFSLHLIGWKAFSGPSGTQQNLLSTKSPDQVGTALNTNEPRGFLGTEAQWSLLYGKLSLVGKSIIHYDLHFMAGLGAMKTETGTDFTQHVGVGQQFFLGKNTSLMIDYRLIHYHETINQKVIPTQIGQPVGTRENYSNVITLGIGFMFGGGAK